MTQSAVSEQVAQLEELLSMQLFHRTGSGLFLTPAGQAYFHDAQNILQQLELSTLNLMAHGVEADIAHLTDGMGIVHSITLSHGKNAHVWDIDGRRYIDFFGGISVLNFGHCHPAIVEAITTQATKLTHAAYNATYHAGYTEYIKKLTNIVPIDDDLSVMLTNSGAEAVENALKIVRQKTGRAGFLPLIQVFMVEHWLRLT